MNKRIIIAVLCSSIVTALSGVAFAQNQPGQQPGQPRPTQPGQTQPGRPSIDPQRSAVEGAAGAAARGIHSMQEGKLVKSTQVVGSSVQSQQRQNVGQIRDIAIDPKSGRVEFALVSLSASPTTPGATPGATTPGATTPRPTTPGITTPETTTRPGATPPGATTPGTTTPPGLTPPGATRDAAADPSGRYDRTGAQAMGKLVAVPWQLLSHGEAHGITDRSATTPGAVTGMAGSQTFTVQADLSKLQSAPTIDQSDLTQLGQAGFAQRVYSHFGLDWNNRMNIGVGAPGLDTERGTSPRQTYPPGTTRPDDTTTPGAPRTPGTPATPGTPGTPRPN